MPILLFHLQKKNFTWNKFLWKDWTDLSRIRQKQTLTAPRGLVSAISNQEKNNTCPLSHPCRCALRPSALFIGSIRSTRWNKSRETLIESNNAFCNSLILPPSCSRGFQLLLELLISTCYPNYNTNEGNGNEIHGFVDKFLARISGNQSTFYVCSSLESASGSDNFWAHLLKYSTIIISNKSIKYFCESYGWLKFWN